MNSPLLRPAGSTSQTVTCQVCCVQAAKYTCPACNLRYCSLACFRSEKHANCSETFYKDSLLQDIQSREDVPYEEKKQILDMFARLQDLDTADEDPNSSTSDIADDALAALDLNSATVDDMLKHLTDAQKAEFEAILRDPTKRYELAELVPNDVVELPWWSASAGAIMTHQGTRPTPVPITQLLQVTTDEPLRLEYNLLAIILAYVFEQMTLRGESAIERVAMLAKLLPFLTEASTTRLESAEASLNYVLDHIDADAYTQRSVLALKLLQDATVLLGIPVVRPADLDAANCEDNAFLVLSDLHTAFVAAKRVKKATHPLAAPKSLFYLSNLGRIPRKTALMQLDVLLTKLKAEQAESFALQESVSPPTRPTMTGATLIEEL